MTLMCGGGVWGGGGGVDEQECQARACARGGGVMQALRMKQVVQNKNFKHTIYGDEQVKCK